MTILVFTVLSILFVSAYKTIGKPREEKSGQLLLNLDLDFSDVTH